MHIAEHFSFADWYSQELRFLLQAPPTRVLSSFRNLAAWGVPTQDLFC